MLSQVEAPLICPRERVIEVDRLQPSEYDYYNVIFDHGVDHFYVCLMSARLMRPVASVLALPWKYTCTTYK